MELRSDAGGAGDAEPAFRSLTLRDIPVPDFVDLVAVPLPGSATTDPEVWARTLFSVDSSPGWVRFLFGLRESLVRLIGVEQADPSVFDVCLVEGDEALISADERHLNFRAGVGVDKERSLVRVTTVVKLHGRRGRLYFAPVKVLHPIIVQAMMRKAARLLAGDPGTR